MLAPHLRKYIVRPALQHIDSEIPYTMQAEDLLVGIACAESNCGEFVYQVVGPARGVFQMEPPTERDVWDNFLHFRPKLGYLIQELMLGQKNDDPQSLSWSPFYAAAMARVQIFRYPEMVPNPDYLSKDDYFLALGELWKLRYNTPLGKGTVNGFVEKVRRYGDIA